jgi:hypothetical protein
VHPRGSEPHSSSRRPSRESRRLTPDDNAAGRFEPRPGLEDRLYPVVVSIFAVVLLAAAVALLAAAEWPRLARRLGVEAQRARGRARRKARLRIVRSEPDESDEFARSVERDLASLPTIDPRDVKKQ